MLFFCRCEMERGVDKQSGEYDRREPEPFFLKNPWEVCDKKDKSEDHSLDQEEDGGISTVKKDHIRSKSCDEEGKRICDFRCM